MSIRTKLAAAPFAHLLGLAVRAEDDESRKGKRAEDEDEDKKSRRAEEDDDEDKGKKSKKAKRAKDEGDDEDEDDDKKSRRAEEDDKDDEGEDDDKSKRGKKAKKAEDDDAEDDDDEDEMKGSSASAKARRRERARCAAIFASPAAAGIPHVAANLAFNTNMSRSAAIAVLQSVAASAPSRRGNLAERMSSQSVPAVGLDGGKAAPSGMSPVAAAIIAAGEKARPGK